MGSVQGLRKLELKVLHLRVLSRRTAVDIYCCQIIIIIGGHYLFCLKYNTAYHHIEEDPSRTTQEYNLHFSI
jgi:hypothetical protein